MSYTPRNQPRPGEVPLKRWLADMADKNGVFPLAIWKRVWRYHTLPAPKLRRVNRRVIFVKT
jgi:hypothetical protein